MVKKNITRRHLTIRWGRVDSHNSEARYAQNTFARKAERIWPKRPADQRIRLNQTKPSAIPRTTPPFTQWTSHANPKQSYPRTSSAKRHITSWLWTPTMPTPQAGSWLWTTFTIWKRRTRRPLGATCPNWEPLVKARIKPLPTNFRSSHPTRYSLLVPNLSVAKRGYASKKVTWRELFQCFLCLLKASFQWHIMRRK